MRSTAASGLWPSSPSFTNGIALHRRSVHGPWENAQQRESCSAAMTRARVIAFVACTSWSTSPCTLERLRRVWSPETVLGVNRGGDLNGELQASSKSGAFKGTEGGASSPSAALGRRCLGRKATADAGRTYGQLTVRIKSPVGTASAGCADVFPAPRVVAESRALAVDERAQQLEPHSGSRLGSPHRPVPSQDLDPCQTIDRPQKAANVRHAPTVGLSNWGAKPGADGSGS